MAQYDSTPSGPQPVKAEERYSALMAHESLDALSPADAIQHVGWLVDVANHLHRAEALERAIAWADPLLGRTLSSFERRIVNYHVGNAWASLRAMRESSQQGGLWAWEQAETEKALIHYRRALPTDGEGTAAEAEYHCRTLTNMANQYSTVGRFIIAIDAWTAALAIDSSFGMARANRGVALWHYAKCDYDLGHQSILLQHAYADIGAGIANGVEPYARQHFEAAKREIERSVSPGALGLPVDDDGASLGETSAEDAYRRWCLRERLFLNTLNDLGPLPTAAYDVLHLPSMVVPIDEAGPVHHGFYNQIKQEYTSARYLLYEGVTSEEPHFADAGVLLYDTFDYSVFALSVEKVRLAFRSAYSLLDKVSYLLNDYLKLGIQPERVSFRNVWYKGGTQRKGIDPCLASRTNWPLRGLFWLSKDLVTSGAEYEDAIEPDARELARIRNHLEHKYLQVHEMAPAREASATCESDIAFRVSRSELVRKTLRLMRRARAALIYLSLAVHQEERWRQTERGDDAKVVPAPLCTVDDAWKV